jgi:hypothetical protein
VHLAGSGAAALQAVILKAGGTVKSSPGEAEPDIVFVAKLAAAADPRKAPPDPLYVKSADAKPLAEQSPA